MRNLPSYEEFVGESYEAIRKAMKRAGVSGSSKEDVGGTTVTFRSDADRDAAAAEVRKAGMTAEPVDGHALRVTEGRVDESYATTVAVASAISDYQKSMSRESFDKLVDRVAANLDLHNGLKRKQLEDHLANSLPRPDDDERLSRKDIADLAGEVVHGSWMGESLNEASRNPAAALREFALGWLQAELTGVAPKRADEVGAHEEPGDVAQWKVDREKGADGDLEWALHVALDEQRMSKVEAKLSKGRYEASMAKIEAWFSERGLRVSAGVDEPRGDAWRCVVFFVK